MPGIDPKTGDVQTKEADAILKRQAQVEEDLAIARMAGDRAEIRRLVELHDALTYQIEGTTPPVIPRCLRR